MKCKCTQWPGSQIPGKISKRVVAPYLLQMDMLSCQESKAKSTLEETIALLQQTQHSCEELRQQLHEKDVEWAQRQQEREHLQRTELQQGKCPA